MNTLDRFELIPLMWWEEQVRQDVAVRDVMKLSKYHSVIQLSDGIMRQHLLLVRNYCRKVYFDEQHRWQTVKYHVMPLVSYCKKN